MSTPTPIFDPEDPKLTAYALGELTDPAECAEVERLLQHSPEAQFAMKEIKDTVLVLTAEYDQERRTAAEPVSPLNSKIIDLANRPPERRWSWVGPLLAAAAVLLAVALVPVFQSKNNHLSQAASSGWTSYSPLSSPPLVTELEPAPGVPGASDEAKSAAPAAPGLPFESAKELQAEVAMLDKKQSEVSKDLEQGRAVNSFDAAAAAPFASAPVLTLDQNRVGRSSMALTQPARGEHQKNPGQAAAAPLGEVYGARRSESGAGGTALAQGVATNLSGFTGQPAAAKPASPATATLRSTRSAADGSYAETRSRLEQVDGQWEKPIPAGALIYNQKRAKWEYPSNLSTGRMDNLSDRLAVARDRLASLSQKETRAATDFNTAAYDQIVENTFLTAKENPLSTFSIDVDTASYANVRRFIKSGSLPPAGAVRIEEMINYFPYDYAPPAADSDKPFAVHLEAASCPWAPEHRLVRVGIKGKEMAADKRPASNLVFLLDVSGSMEPPERLPLIKKAMSMMVEHLDDADHVAIVTYAGNSGLVLPSTDGAHKDVILAALDRLEAGGSTNGASGIELAYKVAKENFIQGGTNRVILATDGDFNVGVTDQDALIRLIQDEAKSGVFLSALGVGTDNFKDSTMQKLADKGNGNYNYLDRLEEARKVLVDQMGATLVTIAKDVKIQVEFNPAVVASYRLIGYEKRMLRKEDFNDDRIDAGEIGAGHSVTALYEVVPVGQPTPQAAPAVDALKYGPEVAMTAAPHLAKAETAGAPEADAATKASAPVEMLTLKMRHKAPDSDKSERTYEVPLLAADTTGEYGKASADFRFAAAVAEFGLVLRDSSYKGNATLGASAELAQDAKGTDSKGYRAGFVELVRKAQALKDGR